MLTPRGDFDWETDNAVVLAEQPAVAVFFNANGVIAVRQEASWDEDDDAVVILSSPDNARAVAHALLAIAEKWSPAEKPRSPGAERQRRWRQRNRSGSETHGDVTGETPRDDQPQLLAAAE